MRSGSRQQSVAILFRIHRSVVEHFTRNEGVAGSSPAVSIILDSCVVKLCCIIYKIRIICI